MASSLMNNDEQYQQAPLNLIAGPDGAAPTQAAPSRRRPSRPRNRLFRGLCEAFWPIRLCEAARNGVESEARRVIEIERHFLSALRGIPVSSHHTNVGRAQFFATPE